MGVCGSKGNECWSGVVSPPSAVSGPTLLESRSRRLAQESNIASKPSMPYLRAGTVETCSGTGTPSDDTDPVAESLNTILEHLWPKISAYTSELIAKDVQPALEASLPQALRRGFRFDKKRCHLGHQPLEFRSFTIEKETQTTGRGDHQNLVFKARVEWKADCSIFLRVARTGIGIKGLTIKGVLLLKLIGLIDKPPFFEGIRAYFTNSPEIDLVFDGAARFLNLGPVHHKIQEVLSHQIDQLMVVPNRMGYAIMPEADIFMIKSPPAVGVLTLTISRANGLLAMDHPWFSQASSDPYVKVKCGALSFQTPTKYKSLSPDFHFEIAIPIYDQLRQSLLFQLFDEDFMKGDDFLGKASVAVRDMISWGRGHEQAIELCNEHGEKGKNGKLFLSAVWRPLSLSTSCHGEGLIFAGVYSAKKLPSMGKGAHFWVNISCTELQLGFQQEPHETARILEPDAKTSSNTEDDNLALTERLKILSKYGMSEADMATILQVDAEELRKSRSQRSVSQAVHVLTGLDRHEIRWDQGFEFPVKKLHKAVIQFEVMCELPHQSPKVLGTYHCSASELATCKQNTSWRTVKVPESGIILKIKLSARGLGV